MKKLFLSIMIVLLGSASQTQTNFFGQKMLYYLSKGDTTSTEEYYKIDQDLINFVDPESGYSTLTAAVSYAQVDAVRWLFSKQNFKPHVFFEKNNTYAGETILWWLVFRNTCKLQNEETPQYKILIILLENGIDPDTTNRGLDNNPTDYVERWGLLEYQFGKKIIQHSKKRGNMI